MAGDATAHSCEWASSSVPGPRWFVAATYPQVEFLAFASLGAFKRYLPTIVTYRTLLKHGRPVLDRGKPKVEAVLRPFFPGYLFVQFDLAGSDWGAINRARGVKRLITTAELRPIPVPVGFVERLMERGRAGDGAIDPGAAKFPPLEPNQRVRVAGLSDGDMDALVERTDQERVWVLLSLFGRETRAEVHRSAVKPVAAK